LSTKTNNFFINQPFPLILLGTLKGSN
jgi:hypothetical protein